MSTFKIVIFAICLSIGSSFAQGNTFIKSVGNAGFDFGRDIKQDNDTGYVITGSSTSFGPDNAEAYLLKLDINGDFVWSYNYGGTGSEWGESLVITNDSTYAITGYSNSEGGAGGFDFYLVRIGEEGVPLWEKRYGGENWDQAFGLIQLPDSGFVMAGESYSYNGGLRHGYMIRTDKNGEVIWENSITGPHASFFTDVALDGDSIVFCGGIGDGGEDTYDGYIYKCHLDGTFGWDKEIGDAYNDYFNAVYAIGGIYSFGGAKGDLYPVEKENFWFYRTSDVGLEIINQSWGSASPEKDVIHDVIARDFDQDYYYAGESTTYGYGEIDSQPDIFIGKMTLSGIQVTFQNIGEAGLDAAYGIDIARDLGPVFICESNLYSEGGSSLLIIKLNTLWEYPDYLTEVTNTDITSSIFETDLEVKELNISPNPFTHTITVSEIAAKSYRVFSIDGQLIKAGEMHTNQIDLIDLENGIYLLTLETEEGIYKKRIVKH